MSCHHHSSLMPRPHPQGERLWWCSADPSGFINNYFLGRIFSLPIADNTMCNFLAIYFSTVNTVQWTQHIIGSFQFYTMHTASYEFSMKLKEPAKCHQTSPLGGVWAWDYRQSAYKGNENSLLFYVLCLPNSSTMDLASFGIASVDFPFSTFRHPPNIVTCVHSGSKLRAVTVCHTRGCAPLGMGSWEGCIDWNL